MVYFLFGQMSPDCLKSVFTLSLCANDSGLDSGIIQQADSNCLASLEFIWRQNIITSASSLLKPGFMFAL